MDTYDISTAGWPLRLTCDHSEQRLFEPDFEMFDVGMTYSIEDPNRETDLPILEEPF